MRVVDCQVHLHNRTYFEAHVGRIEPPWAERADGGYLFHATDAGPTAIPSAYCEIEDLMDDLDAHGVDAVVSSMGAYNVDHLPPTQATELAMQVNEESAELERGYSGRYYGLALLPMQDAQAAIQTLDHAIRTLRLRGVCICSNVNGESIAAPARSPIYQRIEELGAPIFLHPAATAMDGSPTRFGHEHTVTLILDLSIAALDLISFGVLDRHPTLRIVHPYLGGVLPYLVSQIDRRRWGSSSNSERLERADEYLRRFYTDTVSLSPYALRFAADAYGPDHLLYGSDYPYWPPAAGLGLVREEFAGEDLDQVLSGNAVSLLGLGARAN